LNKFQKFDLSIFRNIDIYDMLGLTQYPNRRVTSGGALKSVAPLPFDGYSSESYSGWAIPFITVQHLGTKVVVGTFQVCFGRQAGSWRLRNNSRPGAATVKS
jgi:hypothetical protein